MAFPQDEQTEAQTNAAADAGRGTAGSMADTPTISDTSGATMSAVTFVSATAKQVNTTQDTMLYINITTSATFALALGPDNTTANALVASGSAAVGLLTVRVPQGWYVKVTGTVSDFTAKQLPC